MLPSLSRAPSVQINGKKINPDDKRFSVVSDGKKRKLVVKDTLLTDAGDVTVRTNKDESSAKLKVARKETKFREIGDEEG